MSENSEENGNANPVLRYNFIKKFRDITGYFIVRYSFPNAIVIHVDIPYQSEFGFIYRFMAKQIANLPEHIDRAVHNDESIELYEELYIDDNLIPMVDDFIGNIASLVNNAYKEPDNVAETLAFIVNHIQEINTEGEEND